MAPQDIQARTKLALALMAVGHPQDARKEAIAILGQDPSNSDALIILADSSQSNEDIAATEQQFEKCPVKNTAGFHIAEASLAAKKGSIGAASDKLQQALTVDPKSAGLICRWVIFSFCAKIRLTPLRN